MANASRLLINALRKSASNLQKGARYEWGHVGRCNCGHLVQTVTQKSALEIYKTFGIELDEWTEHANDYCPATNLSIESIFNELDAIGFDRNDVRKLENLSDNSVLKRLPEKQRYLQRNNREDVALYFTTMADILEEELVC